MIQTAAAPFGALFKDRWLAEPIFAWLEPAMNAARAGGWKLAGAAMQPTTAPGQATAPEEPTVRAANMGRLSPIPPQDQNRPLAEVLHEHDSSPAISQESAHAGQQTQDHPWQVPQVTHSVQEHGQGKEGSTRF